MTIIDLEAPAAHRASPVHRNAHPSNPGELVAAAVRSEPGAWEALLDRYGRMVSSIARAHRLSEADAADVSQTVWLRLLEHLDRLNQPAQVGGWLATTARNESLRLARLRGRTAPVENLDSLNLVDDVSDRVPAVEADERDNLLRAAVAGLPSQQRSVLQMLMSDPRPSYDEVSAQLGMPVGSIGPTRQRSLRTLRLKCVAGRI